MRFSKLDLIIFSVLAGVASTFVRGYAIGLENDVENLPQILRAVDSHYLVNDFLVNASSSFGPRFFYVHLLAPLAKFIPVFIVYLLLTLGVNIAVSLISAYFSKIIFKNNLAGIIAVMFVMSIDSIQIGHASFLTAGVLEPHLLALPSALLSLVFLYKNKPGYATFLAGISSLIHPQVGLLVGLVEVIVLFILFLFKDISLRRLFVPAIIYLTFLSVWVVPNRLTQVTDIKTFYEIWVYFRSRHHLLPSTWDPKEFLDLFAFLSAVSISFYFWQRKKSVKSSHKTLILSIFAAVLGLFLAGFLFVEVIPTRIAASAQFFRLAFVIKWLGFVILSGFIAERTKKIDFYLLLASVLTPVSTLVGTASQFFGRGVFIFAIPLAYVLRPHNRNIFLYSVLVFFALLLSQKAFKKISLVFMAAILFLVIFYLKPPIFRLSDIKGEEAQMAGFASKNTEGDTVFITPPQFGKFRLIAQRAIVVDYKSLPLTDAAIKEWYERTTDLYGNDPYLLEKNYESISKEKLTLLGKKYKASYAILYRGSLPGYPELFETETYKLVKL